MITNLHPDSVYAVHLRAQSTTGGKDWVGSVTANGEIHTYWGRTGQVVQHAAKPGSIAELSKIIKQKQTGTNRYYVIDQYEPNQGWHSQSKQQPPVQAQPVTNPAEPAVDWVEAPSDSINWDF